MRHPVLALLHALGWLKAESFAAWWVLLRALFADPLTDSEADRAALALYRAHTGRSHWPTRPSREALVLSGRRSGKTLVLTRLVAAIAAAFERARHPGLAPGEIVVILLLASDKEQSRIAYRYLLGALRSDPALARLIVSTTQARTVLANGVEIVIATSDFRLIRGRTVLAAVCDEVAFWLGVSVNPAEAVLQALRPALSLPDSLLLLVSSTYSQTGPTWDLFKRYYGQEDADVAVWRSDTLTMNPTFSAETIARAERLDPESAAAEYHSQFRTDVSAFLPREVVEAAVDVGVWARVPEGTPAMVAFCDPAGGGGKHADEFVVAFGHPRLRADDVVESVIDEVIAASPPYDVDAVVSQIAEACRRWGVTTLVGDRYAGSWPSAAFARYGLAWLPCTTAKSDLFLEALPYFTSQRVRLVDDRHAVAQLIALERKSGKAKDSVDHPPHGHDDRANSIAGCVVLCQSVAADLLAANTAVTAAEAHMLRSFSKEFGFFDPAEVGRGDVEVDPDGSVWDVTGP